MTVANVTAGTNIDPDWGNAVTDQLNADHAAWTGYTPTISQGTSTDITKTVTYAKYMQTGRTVHCTINVALTAAGQAGTIIEVTLPVAASSALDLVGSALLSDANGSRYVCIAVGSGTQKLKFLHDTSGTGNTGLGASPAVTIASGDILQTHITYEAA